MDNHASAAFGFRTHRILGYRLQPLSSAHAAALDASGIDVFNNPMDPVQMVTFLRICSKPICRKTMRPIGWPEQRNGLREIAALGWMAVSANLVSVSKRIQLYLVDNLASPSIRLPVGKQGSGKNGDVHFARVALAIRAGLDGYEAWSTSIGFLDWILAHHAVNEGAQIKIVDPLEDAKRIAQLKELERVLKEKKQA